MKEAQELAQSEWQIKCSNVAEEVEADVKSRLNGSLMQAHNLTLQLSQKAVELQQLLEVEAQVYIELLLLFSSSSSCHNNAYIVIRWCMHMIIIFGIVFAHIFY
jgi:hypothetical protein